MKVIYESPSTRIIKLSQNPAICQTSDAAPQYFNPVKDSPNYEDGDWS